MYYSTSGILPLSLKCQLTLKQQLKYSCSTKCCSYLLSHKNCISVKLKLIFSHSEARWDDRELLAQKKKKLFSSRTITTSNNHRMFYSCHVYVWIQSNYLLGEQRYRIWGGLKVRKGAFCLCVQITDRYEKNPSDTPNKSLAQNYSYFPAINIAADWASK